MRRIQESEVKDILKRMKGGNAMGPDGIPIEVWNKMPDEWRQSILVPIFKNKGDVQSCTNYREIKLMSHTMKLWERIIEHLLRGVTNVTENQF
jgi:hypothetical protein